MRSIFGADKYDSGSVFVDGVKTHKASLKRMKSLGLALTPEERKTEGLVLTATIGENLIFASLDDLAKKGFMQKRKEKQYIDNQVHDLQIKIASPKMSINSLSGGNQQKVVIGNWLNTNPKVMLFDEPSRGIDVAAKQQIFKIMWEQSRKGIASIMVSSELEELLEVCQRILVMRHGVLTGEVYPDDLNINDLYAYAMGEEQQ